ncbi:MAG: hypothetical protein ABGX07_08740, partial [Pirellulaceae bacterium]
ISKTLREFDELLSETGSTLDVPDNIEISSTKWELIPAPHRIAANIPPWPKPRQKKSTVEAQLKIAIGRIQLSETTLDEALELLSHLTTLPVAVDAEACWRLGISTNDVLVWESDNKSVGELFEQLASMLGLTVHIVNRGILLTDAPPNAELVLCSYNVDNLLVGDTNTADKLANVVINLIAKKTWRPSGGRGTIETRESFLNVAQSAAVHFEIARFLERLRLARGASLQGLIDVHKVKLQPRFAPALDRLDTPTTPSNVQPTFLTGILRNLGESSDFDILIDWPSLVAQGWNYETRGTFQCREEPFGEAMSRLLAPLDLSFRVLDEDMLVVTTVGNVESKIDIELYSVTGMLPEQVQQRIYERVRPILGDRLLDKDSGVVLLFDDVSYTVIVAAPQRHQAEVARTLQRMIAEDKAKSAKEVTTGP